jgi:hypothetical protein
MSEGAKDEHGAVHLVAAAIEDLISHIHYQHAKELH